mmetsp:Transcript_31168/g.60099  ORF Transcript_31168/g.60099 Transcript_31168/m.60099 type:complete len:594 (-) Transcript_31168:769-2550(-)
MVGQRLALGVENLAAVVDEHDQVVRFGGGLLDGSGIIGDHGAPALGGEELRNKGGGGGSRAMDVVLHLGVHERELHCTARGAATTRASNELASRVGGQGGGVDGERVERLGGEHLALDRSVKPHQVELEQVGGVGAARWDWALPEVVVNGLGGDVGVRLRPMRNVEPGELGETPTESAAGHLVRLLTRSLGHSRAVVQRVLEADVVGHTEACEAVVHHDGVHRHVDQLGAAGLAADGGEGAADLAVEPRPESGLRHIIPKLLHPPRDAAKVGRRSAGDAVGPEDVAKVSGDIGLPHVLAVPVVVGAGDAADAHVHVVELSRALRDELGHLLRRSRVGIEEHQDARRARRAIHRQRVGALVDGDGGGDGVHRRHQLHKVRRGEVRLQVRHRRPLLDDDKRVGVAAHKLVLQAAVLLPRRLGQLVGHAQPLLLALFGHALDNHHVDRLHRRRSRRSVGLGLGTRRHLRLDRSERLWPALQQVELRLPPKLLPPNVEVVDRVTLVSRLLVVGHVDARGRLLAVPRAHQLGDGVGRVHLGRDARHRAHALLQRRLDRREQARHLVRERDGAECILGEHLWLGRGVRLRDARRRVDEP